MAGERLKTATSRAVLVTGCSFADDQRPLFQALAGSGLGKDSHPEIARAAQAIGAVFLSPAAAATLALISGRDS